MRIIGWDASTSAIGICVFDPGVEPIFEVIFPQGSNHAEKHIDAAKKINAFIERLPPIDKAQTVHVVEERLGGFTGGKTTRQTLMCLAAMNAIVSFVLKDTGRVVKVLPVTAKKIVGLITRDSHGNKIDKKSAVIKLACERNPNFPNALTSSGNYKKGVDDMADAWLLAEVGRLTDGHPEGYRKPSRTSKVRKSKKL